MSEGNHPEILCAGHVNWDVTMQVDSLPAHDGEAVIADQWESGGGSASNTAGVIASLGQEPLLLGSVGADRYGELALHELEKAGVDCSAVRVVENGETTVKYLVVDEDGRVMVLANDGANEAFSATDLPDDRLRAARHLHLTSQHPDTARDLARRATEAGITVSIDPGRRLEDRNFADVILYADVVFFNDREADAALENGLVPPADGDCVTVVKEGHGGASLWNGNDKISHEGFEVEPMDTAGAGDAFAAGFLLARLDGASDEEALAVGNACGAIAVQSLGARSVITWEDIRSYSVLW